MATSKQKAFCVLQFSKTESAIAVQRAFRIKFDCQTPNDNNILRWFHQFETTGCLCKEKSTGRPRLVLPILMLYNYGYFLHWKEVKQNTSFSSKIALLASLSTRLVKFQCTQPMD
ncbi:DUF4817 domain-containing protein [Trichonephila clavipes]|nr:DUF4817 domain-containing protein [Trichonephila clavipes]